MFIFLLNLKQLYLSPYTSELGDGSQCTPIRDIAYLVFGSHKSNQHSKLATKVFENVILR